MFSGNRCYKIWLLCTFGRNHPKKYIYSSVTCLQFTTLLKMKTHLRGVHCVQNSKTWASIMHRFKWKLAKGLINFSWRFSNTFTFWFQLLLHCFDMSSWCFNNFLWHISVVRASVTFSLLLRALISIFCELFFSSTEK